ncbi:hypothetical protein M0R88_17210 [Halorussus gelatinilyticus]|uniref:Uncharacterized protein n=1 Tax=Halorussus gelatinilyticus TaxID=2937524 RepID=A0A8U0IHS6_9EURY|nr:hypothetical protein [Halorussus gelatinilyticus]UPW00236.1 hypothetical protein M0R88_17210 [Halorussus gelatinilyticus]
MYDLLRSASQFLDDHWVLKWFAVPILFMASMLFALGLVLAPSAVQTTQLAGLFVGFSLAVVAVGLALDWLVRRATGWNLLASNRERG